jgi:hypothetical protein
MAWMAIFNVFEDCCISAYRNSNRLEGSWDVLDRLFFEKGHGIAFFANSVKH